MGGTPGKKARRNSHASRGETLAMFVDWAASHRLWVGAAMFALACISYANTWFSAAPARAGEILRSQVEEVPAEADLNRYSAIVGHVGASVGSFEAALQAYRRDFTNKPFPEGPVPPGLLADGLAATDSARAAVDEAVGFIRGSTFFDKRLEERRPPLAGDLMLLDSTLVQIRRFYVAAGAGDGNAMRAANEQIRRLDQTGRQGWSAAYAHLGTLNDAFLASGTGSVARLYEQAERLRWYRIQRLLAWGAVVYVIGFAVAAGVTWLKRRRSPAPRGAAARR